MHAKRSQSFRPIPTAAAIVIAALMSLLLVGAPPAGAHGDEGEMTVIAAEPGADPDTVRVEIGLLYANDDDLATEATVTATLTNADGQTVGPVPVPRIEDARYGTEIAVPSPGTWTVVVTSTNPDAESDPQTVEVSAAPSTTATTASDGDGATEPSPLIAPAPDASGASASAPTESSDDSSVLPIVIIVVVVVVIALAIGGFLIARRRGATS